MNDLNLRVSGGIGEKVKKPVAPITMPYWNAEHSGVDNVFLKIFLSSDSADDQLKILKQYLNKHIECVRCRENMVEFLVLLLWNADAKHPVKGFLKKHITESRKLREPFTKTLKSIIINEIKDSTDFGDYVGVVTRLDAAIDKFPPGAAAVRELEIDVATYLVHCLESCVKTLQGADGNLDGIKEPLSPTEINKIYDLIHLTLRLLLYIIQKVTADNRTKMSCMFGNIRPILAELMSGKEVPMDTKSVCGIIELTMHLFENGPSSWIELLDKDHSNDPNSPVDLSIYSAIATVIPVPELLAAEFNGQPAVLDLTDRILEIGDRYSSESSHILAVARTLFAISKTLGAAAGGTRRQLVSRLLRFCWGHMEHHVDSVRHLAAQVMGHVLAAARVMQGEGDSSALDEVFSALSTLDGSRKSLWVSLTALSAQLGPALLRHSPGLVRDATLALRSQPVQASVTTFLETLLKHMKDCSTETIYQQVVAVILERVKCESDPAVLSILEKILAKAVQWHSGILEHILSEQHALSSYEASDLKCILLVLGVVRKSGVAYKGITYDGLRHTAYDADDEIRILSLSLVAETPRSTEQFSEDELSFVRHFLRYNINAQAPSFRQLVLSLMKKILKRLEDSFKVLKRNQEEYGTQISFYLSFVEDLQELCFGSLLPGANYSRRCTALQLLAWLGTLQLEGYDRTWNEERAEIIYNVLEDSYENNKALALDILKMCPSDLVAKVAGYNSEAYLAGVLRQASSVKPTECVSASYKILLYLAHHRPPSSEIESLPEQAKYSVLQQILSSLHEQTLLAQDIARAARDSPMYGLVHCAARCLANVDPRAIAGDPSWSALIRDIIAACTRVIARVACVVNADSPEGFLPQMLETEEETDLGGARRVSAQMVLLCAWRSVKETSLLLGGLVSQLTLEGEAPAWTLSDQQVEDIGELLIELLAGVKHRGAFEQAYVGFTMLLGRLWKCTSPRLHQLPLQWFAAIEQDFILPDSRVNRYCATRRGAGLPFMIQALVTTELAAEPTAPRGRLLSRCLELCLSVARAPPSPADASRAHLVLRALCRHCVPPAAATAGALIRAVKGCDADTWMERNSSTLLFSALTVRIFGVQRGRDARKLCVRNRMTGRIFFLRYPELYDFLLEQLQAVSLDALRPSLFPTLLLLSRLYPSALEGTVSNLKLERFLPHVQTLAGAGDISIRRLAARAAAPLLTPHRYIQHLQSLFESLGDPKIKRNLCHGILCQLSVLLDNPPPNLTADFTSTRELLPVVRGSFWLINQATAATACFVIADDFLAVLNLMLLRFPGFFYTELTPIASDLKLALFNKTVLTSAIGREVFLANAASMIIIILTITCNDDDIIPFVLECLKHEDYEVQLSALNFLLMLHDKNEDLCSFLEHLSQIIDKKIIYKLQEDESYVKSLCDVFEKPYLECKQKALKVLTLTPNTQKDLVQLKLGTNKDLSYDDIVLELLDCVKNGHENLSSIYLESVLKLVSKSFNVRGTILEVVRTVHECSSANAGDNAREAVVGFLETDLKRLLSLVPTEDEAEMFEYTATLTATAAMLLEDDEPALRLRTAALCAAFKNEEESPSGPSAVLASRAASSLRRWATLTSHAAALLLTLAAMDFCAHFNTGDELGDECRVFDQNETHNVYLEEFTWTSDCAVKIKQIHSQIQPQTQSIDDFILSLANNPIYKNTLEKLCIEDVIQCLTTQKSVNPKIELLFRILHK